MINLAANTRYYYRVGFTSNSGSFSPVYSFMSRPNSEQVSETRFLMYGDLGGEWAGSGHLTTARMIDSNEVEENEFTLLVGDVSYEDGQDEYWDIYVDQIEPIAARHPFMVQVGNHEEDYGECCVPLDTRFHVPDNNYDGNSLLWYSFTWGLIKFVVMSTEHDFDRGSEQHDYLVREMANINRTATPWLIFTGHRPMYLEDFVDPLLQRQLEEELIEYAVDLVTVGHVHLYERSCSIIDNECETRSDNNHVYHQPQAPVHLLVGMAGRGFDYGSIFAEMREMTAAATGVPAAKMDDITEVSIYELGYARFVANHTHLSGYFIREDNGSVADYFTIAK